MKNLNELENLANMTVRLLRWTQQLPEVVIPAGLESDVQEAIIAAQAIIAISNSITRKDTDHETKL